MRWMVVAVLCGCGSDAFVPLTEIAPVECGRPVGADVYGEVEVDHGTVRLDHVADVEFFGSSLTEPGLYVTNDHETLYVGTTVDKTYVELDSQHVDGTARTIVFDCPGATGRFEAHFATGELSGWFSAPTGGW